MQIKRYDNMKSIGIITFHESPNYGAILQSFALQEYLRECGYEVKIIDYRNADRQFAQVHGIKRIRSIIWNATLRKLFIDRIRTEKTKNFKEKFIHLTDHSYTNKNTIKSDPPKFDCYITGSDQVWNKRNNNGDTTYFLDFAPSGKRRISYAPSFGAGQMNNDYLELIKPYIDKIDCLSVREISGAEIIQKLCSRSAQVVCDPVFLLTREQWQGIMKTPEEPGYILCYYMPGDKIVENTILEISKKIQSKTGLRIVNIGKKEYDKLKFWEPNRFDFGPEEFVGAIANAEYIVTNSFHGTAFSVLFEKKVAVPYRTDLSREKALNTRMVELIEMAGRNNSLVPCSAQFDFELFDSSETAYSMKMEKYIEDSKRFLLEAIQN